MNVNQFMIYLMIADQSEVDDGSIHSNFRCLEVDLVDGDITDFLSRIPETVNENSQVWVSIKIKDSNRISYVDGLECLAPNSLPANRLSADRAEDLRRNASIWADRALGRKLATE